MLIKTGGMVYISRTVYLLCVQNDRKLILETLGKKLHFADDVNLAHIAEKTEGFTGADLQAVLYAAQMLAYDTANEGKADCIIFINNTVCEYILIYCRQLTVRHLSISFVSGIQQMNY